MSRTLLGRSSLLNQATDNRPIEKVVDMPTGVLEAIDPRKTRMYRIHGRMTGSMSGESMEELIESIRENNQRTPAVGYKLEKPDKDGVEVILLSGARRREAAITLQRNLLVSIIAEPIDSEKVRMMVTENQGRRDYTPYELGRELLMVIEEKCFANAKSAIAALGIKKSTGHRAIKIASLPDKVLKAWKDPSRMNATQAERIAMYLDRNDDGAQRIVAEADVIYRETQGLDEPEPRLLKAVERKSVESAAKSSSVQVTLGPKKSPVGQLVIGGDGKQLSLRLNNRVDPDVRDKVLKLLKEIGIYKG